MKRIISFILCLSMVFSMMPVSAFAADVEQIPDVTEVPVAAESTPEETETSAPAETAAPTIEWAEFCLEEESPLPEETEEIYTADVLTWVPQQDLPDDDELFAVYAQQQFYGNVATLGTAAGDRLDSENKKLYDALVKQIRRIAAGELDSSVIAVGNYLGVVSAQLPDGSILTLPCTPEEETVFNGLNLNLGHLLSVLLSDLPYDLYWFDKTMGVSVYPVSTSTGKLCYVFYFKVSADYSLDKLENTCDVNTGATGAATEAAENARSIASAYASSSDYEKLVGFKEELCALTDYNYAAASSSSTPYGDPWQMIYMFDGDPSTKVVCEGYSKSFQYLCDISDFDADITCYSVVGFLNPKSTNHGAHMWNIVSIEGKNYLVDVTNCDAAKLNLFLRGGELKAGVYYYDYSSGSGVFTYDSQTYGTYVLSGNTFVYDRSNTVDFWGSEVLTLDTADFDPASLDKTPEPDPSVPETPPEEDDGVLTGEELVEILENSADPWYTLTETVEISTDIQLPAVSLQVTGTGTITVKDGGSLTVTGSLGVANGGTLTVEEGASMTVEGSFAIGGGTTVSIDGTLTNNGFVNIQYGSLVVNGSYISGESAINQIDQFGTLSGDGIDTALFALNAMAWNESSFRSALTLREEYGSQTVIVVNNDLNDDGTPDPITLNADVSIPEGIDLQVGYYVDQPAQLRISNRASLTALGNIFVIPDSSIIVEEGSMLINNGLLYNEGTVNCYGTFYNYGTCEGNPVNDLISLDRLEQMLLTSNYVDISKPLVLTDNFTLPAGKSLVINKPGRIVIPEGMTLTVEGALTVFDTNLTVESGGKLQLKGWGSVGFSGNSTLQICDGGEYSIPDGTQIKVDGNTTLIGISKSEVVRTVGFTDPNGSLQDFADTYAGYKTLNLHISTDYTLDEDVTLESNVVLDLFDYTLTITDGATMTVNSSWSVGRPGMPGHIVVEDGTLAVNGNLSLLYGSTLKAAQGAGTVTVTGQLSGSIETYIRPMTGEELIRALENCTDVNYRLTRPVVIENSITLPNFPNSNPGIINIEAGGSITVRNGGSLTTSNTLDVANGGFLTLEEGGSLTVDGVLCVGVGGTATIAGNWSVQRVVLNHPGTITGIDPSHIHFYGFAQDEASLLEALAVQGYATHEVNITDASILLTQDAVIPEGCALIIGDEMCTPAVLEIAEGVTLTNNGSIGIWPGASLILKELAHLAGDGPIYNDGTIVNHGIIDCTIEGPGSVTNILSESAFRQMLANAALTGETVSLEQDMTLKSGLQLNCTLVICEGVTLTVPENVTLLNNGQIILEENSTLDVRGRYLGYLPCLNSSTSRFVYGEDSLTFTQDTLVQQLTESADTGKCVYLSIPMTLTKDLTVPAGAELVLSGGVITVPTERTLTNNGTIQMTASGGVTGQGSGILANNGIITLSNYGKLDMSAGEYLPGKDGQLRLVYRDQGTSAAIGATLIGNIYDQVTFVWEGWNEASMLEVLQLAGWMAPVKAVELTVCGAMTLSKNLELAENMSLSIRDLGMGPASLTVPRNITLTNSGSVTVGLNGTLAVAAKGSFVGNLPACIHETAAYTNANSKDQAYLEGLLANSTATLTVPVLVTGELEIPAGVTLTISGKGAYLILGEGAVVTNNGFITCQNGGGIQAQGGQLINNRQIETRTDGIVDMTGGTYRGYGSIYEYHTCDASGTVSHSTIRGIPLGDLIVRARTESDDTLIREMIAVMQQRLDNGEGPEDEWTPFFSVYFGGNTVLSADLELPVWSNPVVQNGATLRVPEGMTLTDRSGMAMYGTLIAEGSVIATDFPFAVYIEENLVHPENCVNYYVMDKPLETITARASASTVQVGNSIQLWLESWEPATAAYFGEYDVAILDDTTGSVGYGWLDSNTVTVYAYDPGTVTLELRPIVGTDYENDYAPIYAECSAVFTLTFTAETLTLFTEEETYDFFEDGHIGMYGGNDLHFFANTTGSETDVAQDLIWTYEELPASVGTVTLQNGILTITAAEDLEESFLFHFTVSDPNGIYGDFSYRVQIRPKAETVDLALGEAVVTGKTLLFDLNRGETTVQLAPFTNPIAAATVNATTTTGERLVTWKSDKPAIATVDDYGNVTFTGATGKVNITMTANFGSKKTVSLTFNVVALPQEIIASEANVTALIGGSTATYTAADAEGNVMKSSAVKWFLCDKDGNAVATHPYASVTAAGKLTTKAVADPYNVYLMAQVVGDETSARLAQPVMVTLYPTVASLQVLDAVGGNVTGQSLLYDVGTLGLSYPLGWIAGPSTEAVQSVSWKSDKAKIATIDDHGIITVSGENAAGTVKFTATALLLNGKKVTATVTMKFGTFTQDLYLWAKLPDGTETDELDDLTVYGGQAISFFAENDPEDVTTSGVTWSVSSKTYGSITAAGKLTTKAVTNPVTFQVYVKSKDGAVTYGIPVTLLPKADAIVLWNEDEEFITKTTQSLEEGSEMQVFASEDVTWKSAKPAIAEVDADGWITANAPGSTTITATAGDGRKATFTLTVTKSFQSITITTQNLTVASGKSLTLAASVRYADGSSTTKVNWSVDNTALATVTSAGKLTAAKNLTKPALVHVTATAKDSGWSTTKAVQILPLTTALEIFSDIGTKHPSDVTNTTQMWDLRQGDSLSLSVRSFPEGAMEDVTWKSSSTKIATVAADGTVTCLKAGTVTITATAKDGSGKKATFKLTVHRTMAEGTLQLPGTAFIAGGKSLTLKPVMDAEASNKTLSWSMAYPNGAAVPATVATLSKGTLKTKAVKAPVTLIVTASATDGSGETAKCAVTVYPAAKGVQLYDADLNVITKKTVSVPVNQAFTLKPDTTNVAAYGLRDDKTADEYLTGGEAWTVTLSKAGIAEVTFDGQDLIVTAIGEPVGQSLKITLKANDGSGKSAYVTLTFTEASPE